MMDEELDILHYQERIIAAVKEGLADGEAGRVYEDEEVKRLLEEEFGSLDETDPAPDDED
jgi:predicted transcriptional regulator